MLAMALMMAAIYLTRPVMGIYLALVVGGLVDVAALVVLLRRHWAREEAQLRASAAPGGATPAADA